MAKDEPADLAKERKTRETLKKELKKVTEQVEPKGTLKDIFKKIDDKKKS